MAKPTIASVRTLGWIVLGALACANAESPGDAMAASERARIPEVQRAADPAPGDAISIASLSEGGVLQPGFGAEGSALAASTTPGTQVELPAEVLAYLGGDLADHGSLELQPSPEVSRGIPISLTSDVSLLGEEFDFPAPQVAPPAAPAL